MLFLVTGYPAAMVTWYVMKVVNGSFGTIIVISTDKKW